MTVETAADRAIFFSPNDFAEPATYTPVGGSPSIINGIFDDEFFEADAGGMVTVAVQQPQFLCKTSDVPSAANGDGLSYNSVSYIIRIAKRDGTGTTTLVLEES